MSKIRSVRPIRGLICLALTLLLTLPLLWGCSQAVSVPGWKRAMTIGQMDVSEDMLRYFVMNSIYNSSTEPELFKTDPDTQAKLEEDVYDMLRLLAAYVELADRYDLSLSGDEKSALKDQIDAMKEEYRNKYDSDWKKEYQAYLDTNYITEDVLYHLLVIDNLKSKVYDYLINEYTSPIRSDDETIRKDIEAGNWFNAEYVGLTVDQSITDPEEKSQRMQKLREAAEEILRRAQAGESLNSLTDEYRKTFGMDTVAYQNLGGFTLGQEMEYFEQTVQSLEIGKYSEVCEIPGGGFYVAHRLPLDDDYITSHLDSVFRAGYLDREIARIADACGQSLEIKLQGKYKDFEFWTME